MAQNFRSAFRGFNRDDVVHYLEYLNNKHKTELNQLLSERDSLRSDLEAASRQPLTAVPTDDGLSAKCAELTLQLEQLRSMNAQLEARCAELESRKAPVMFSAQPDQELEAYRRAERVERAAKERADLVYRQTDSLLASAAAQVDSLTEQMTQAASQFNQQLEQLQLTAANSTASLRDASATLHRIRSEKQ